MTTNQDFKNAALDALRGKWAPAIIATIVYYLIVMVVYGSIEFTTPTLSGSVKFIVGGSFILGLFFYMPISLGYFNSTKALYVTGDDKVTRNMFHFGFTNYFHKVWGMLLVSVFEMLWCLLFIIPGLIMAYAYALTPYILEEEPELSAMQAIKKSRTMMKGHKFDLFWLEFSFIGWILLSLLTLGIGLFWLLPYMYTSIAAFYENLKETAEVAAAE